MYVCELRCNSLRGALYRRAPLSQKASTGCFLRFTPAELLRRRVSLVATSDQRLRASGLPQTFEKV